MLVDNVGTQSINPLQKLSYNPDTAFVPLGQFAELPFVLAVAMPEIQQQMMGQDGIAKGGTPADFAKLISTDRKRYARIIFENKLTAD